MSWFAGLIALVGLERLAELRLSLTNTRPGLCVELSLAVVLPCR